MYIFPNNVFCGENIQFSCCSENNIKNAIAAIFIYSFVYTRESVYIYLQNHISPFDYIIYSNEAS